MMSYRRDRTWSDAFIPAIKRIVGAHVLEPSSFEIDAHEAADLVVLIARDLRIAARVRRPGFADRYPYQFTIRAHRDSGALTELQKIVDGWGDWLFYGHAVDDRHIGAWMIVSLHALRAAMIRRLIAPDMMGCMNNGDGTRFRWFDIRGFAQARIPILVASSFDITDDPAPAAAAIALWRATQQLDLFV
jgi:hypothetical protein